MAELKYPRFNTIYATRDEALSKLNDLTRSYGEPVAIRYYNNTKKICVLLAIFKSELKGDYEISYDSNPEMTPRVYTVIKVDTDISDVECINAALFGKTPIQNDIVILTDSSETVSVVRSYIFVEGSWTLLATPTGAMSSVDIGSSLLPVKNEDGSVSLEVKVDNSTITYDEATGGLTVNKLNGGTF